MDEEKYMYRAFHSDQIKRFDDPFIIVEMLTMAGPFDVQWEIVRRDTDLNQIIARRLKREGE